MASKMADLRRALADGKNLMELMRREGATDLNDETTILYSYDLQAGSYAADFANPGVAELKGKVGAKLAGVLEAIGAEHLTEAGIGEGTTLGEVLRAAPFLKGAAGFDISLSRLLHARAHLATRGQANVLLFTGSIETAPLADDSADTVFTFHAIEPNGGRERPILEELLRITKHHLVLVEPTNELGTEATKKRIDKFRYCKNLHATLKELGAKVVRFEPWGLDANPENEAALIVVEKRARGAKGSSSGASGPTLASPLSRTPLQKRADCWFSDEDGLAFPIIDRIPCLLAANGIVATQLAAFDKKD